MGTATRESDPSIVLQTYEQRCLDAARERDGVADRSRVIAHGRFALFVAFVAILAWIEAVGTQGTMKIALAGLVAIAFLVLVVVHRQARQRWSGLVPCTPSTRMRNGACAATGIRSPLTNMLLLPKIIRTRWTSISSERHRCFSCWGRYKALLGKQH